MLSIAELKRRLPVGKEFTAEFIGSMNMRVIGNLGVTNLIKPENERISLRKVIKQGSQMVSKILTGPKTGHDIHLHWRGVKARVDTSGSIVLTGETGNDFLKITI